MLTHISLEGIDGSGKTSVASELTRIFRERDLKPVVFSPYQLINKRLGFDIYQLWQNPETVLDAALIVKDTLLECAEVAAEQHADITIYDRHWMTAFTEIGDNPAVIEEWGDALVPTALLKVSKETSKRRARNDMGASWMQDSELDRYSQAYCDLGRKYGDYLLGIYRSDDDITPQALAKAIAWDMNIRR